MKIQVDINLFLDAMTRRKRWLESARVINLSLISFFGVNPKIHLSDY